MQQKANFTANNYIDTRTLPLNEWMLHIKTTNISTNNRRRAIQHDKHDCVNVWNKDAVCNYKKYLENPRWRKTNLLKFCLAWTNINIKKNAWGIQFDANSLTHERVWLQTVYVAALTLYGCFELLSPWIKNSRHKRLPKLEVFVRRSLTS